MWFFGVFGKQQYIFLYSDCILNVLILEFYFSLWSYCLGHYIFVVYEPHVIIWGDKYSEGSQFLIHSVWGWLWDKVEISQVSLFTVKKFHIIIFLVIHFTAPIGPDQ